MVVRLLPVQESRPAGQRAAAACSSCAGRRCRPRRLHARHAAARASGVAPAQGSMLQCMLRNRAAPYMPYRRKACSIDIEDPFQLQHNSAGSASGSPCVSSGEVRKAPTAVNGGCRVRPEAVAGRGPVPLMIAARAQHRGLTFWGKSTALHLHMHGPARKFASSNNGLRWVEQQGA